MGNGLKGPIAVFFMAFGVYLWTMPPSLPAYRDAGEMAASAWTLGVSHPPSYPLYILAGHAVMHALPLGNPAFRLTLFSALSAAAALALLFFLLQKRSGNLPALGAAVVMGCNTTFWSVAGVPEMYSLTLLLALFLWLAALRSGEGCRARSWYAFVFLYGFSLGNRTDILLWAPALFWLALSAADSPVSSRRFSASWFFATAFFGCLGLSIYLYLPLRSLQGPWLDWNHPCTLHNLIGSLTRRSYGATLDMISKNYALGSELLSNLRVYSGHLWNDYLGVGLALVAAGFVAEFRRDRRAWIGSVLAYTVSGPLFLFLANMPPNPHAMAIVEPHYLLSDLVLALWAGQGLSLLGRVAGSAFLPAAAVAVLAILPWTAGRGFTEAVSSGGMWQRVNRREVFLGHDYSLNVLRSLEPDAVLVAKKDVQLFNLWYFQVVEGRRPDVSVVAQGLSASPWYQQARRRLGDRVLLGPLRTHEDWRRFVEVNPKVYATTDADFPPELKFGPPSGLALNLSTAAAASEVAWSFMVRRGEYHYDRQPDFFNADLTESFAAARQRLGGYYSGAGRFQDALRQLYLGWAVKWLTPEAAMFAGFDLYSLGRKEEAADAYRLCIRLFDATLRLTRRYHSLPDLVSSVGRSAAEARVNLGVLLEKSGDKAGAERLYQEAMELAPGYEQPHYNLAVLYWGKDWEKVAREMDAVVRINPGNAAAAAYRAQALRRMQASEQR